MRVEQPADHRQQPVDVHRLGDVVVCTALDRLFAVARHRLGSERDDRQVREARCAPHRSDHLVTIHFRHHDVHQYQRHIRCPVEDLEALTAVLGVLDGDSDTAQHMGQREDVPDVVVDDQDVAVGQHPGGAAGQPLLEPGRLRPAGRFVHDVESGEVLSGTGGSRAGHGRRVGERVDLRGGSCAGRGPASR